MLKNNLFHLAFDLHRGRPSSLRQPNDRFRTEWLATPHNLAIMPGNRSIGFGVIQLTTSLADGWSAPTRWPTPQSPKPLVQADKRKITVTGRIEVGDRTLEIVSTWQLQENRIATTWTLHNPDRTRLRLGEVGWLMPFNTDYGRFPRTRQNLERMYRRQVIEHPYAGGHSGWILAERVGREGDCLFLSADGHTPFTYFDYDYIQYKDRIPFTDRPPYTPPDEDKRAHARYVSMGNHFPWPGVLRMFAAATSVLARHDQRQWVQPVKTMEIEPGQSIELGWSMAWLPDRGHIADYLQHTGRLGVRLLPSPVIPRDDETHLAVACNEQITPQPGPGITVHRRPSKSGRQCFTVRSSRHGPSHLDLARSDGRTTRILLFGTHPLPETMRRRARRIDQEQYYEKKRSPLHGALLIRHNPSGKLVAKLKDLWGSGCYEGGIAEARFLAEKNILHPNPREIRRLQDYANGYLRKIHNRETGEVYWWLPPAMAHRSFNYLHVANFYFAMYRLHQSHPRFGEAHEWLARAMDTFSGMFLHSRPALLPIAQIGGEMIPNMVKACREHHLEAQYADVLRQLARRQQRVARIDPPRPPNNGYENVCLGEYAQARRLTGNHRGAHSVTDIMITARGPQPVWFQYASEKRWWDAIGHNPYRHWSDLGETCLHYSVGSNTQTLLEAYEATGDNLLLELGTAGLRGQWALVDARGHATMCFTPNPLSQNYGWNQYSGDAGVGLSGVVYNATCYVLHDPDFGWIALGGKLTRRGETLRVEPRDAARRRIVIHELGLDIRSPNETIHHAVIHTSRKTALAYSGDGVREPISM